MSCDFELLHIGIHSESEPEALALAELFAKLFNAEVKPGNKSIFAGKYFECMKFAYKGKNGHIAMGTPNLPAAMDELAAKGCTFDMDTAQYDAENHITNVYLNGEFGGFAVHVMQKK